VSRFEFCIDWYRAVLCNYVFSPGVTWGELLDRPGTKANLETLWQRSTVGMSEELRADFSEYWKAAQSFWEVLAIRDLPARMVVEVQLCCRDHWEMRKRTHLWYKVARARNGRELCNDFRSTCE